MAEIDTTRTWAPGDSVDAAKMNEIIDQATTEPAMISGKTVATPVPSADYVMFWDATGPTLKKCKIEELQASTAITDVDSAASPAFINLVTTTPGTGERLITLSWDNVGSNKVLAAPVDGSLGAPSFRVLSPADMPFATSAIAASSIDWNLGVMFTKTLAANTTFSFTGASAGQTIRVLLVQDASHTVAWTGGGLVVRWPGGTNHVMSTGAGARDLLTFHFIGGLYYGTFEQDFLT